MERLKPILRRILFVTYLVIIHVLAAFYIGEKLFPIYIRSTGAFTAYVEDPTPAETAPIPPPVPSIIPTPETPEISSIPATAPGQLLIPVVGVKRSELIDTFTDSRSDERTHDAIDIPAPAGTPVVAAADGTIARFFDSEAGGITIYQISADKRYVYYYAHLQRRADDIVENQNIKQGTVIGYVGDTGNAGPGNFHLHFSISVLTDPARYWEGTYINPYPILLNGVEAPRP